MAQAYLYNKGRNERWKEVTGTITSNTVTATNGWSTDNKYIDLGKDIIPLEGEIFFSWKVTNGEHSTSCGAGASGKTAEGESFIIFKHSTETIGKDSNGSSTEQYTVTKENQKPIRYLGCYCGGGIAGEGSTTEYSTRVTITRWLEKETETVVVINKELTPATKSKTENPLYVKTYDFNAFNYVAWGYSIK